MIFFACWDLSVLTSSAVLKSLGFHIYLSAVHLHPMREGVEYLNVVKDFRFHGLYFPTAILRALDPESGPAGYSFQTGFRHKPGKLCKCVRHRATS